MRYFNPTYLSVDGMHHFDVPENRALVIRGGSRGISNVCIVENGIILNIVTVSRLPFNRWKASIHISPSSNYKRTLTITGLSESGLVLTQTERSVRVIPTSRLVLKKWRYFWDWHYEFRWKWDFKFGKYASIYTIAGFEKDGWRISSGNKLEIPESCKSFFTYFLDVPGTISMMSLFLNTKHVIYGVIGVNLKMDLCANDTLEFEVADAASTIKSLGIHHGKIEDSIDLQFNLHPFIGQDLEFRIIFRATNRSSTRNCRGVSVNNLKVLSS